MSQTASRLGWLIPAACALLGCHRLPADARWLRAGDLGDPVKARSVGLMAGPSHSETVYLPNGQDSVTVQDELTLTRFDEAQVCVEMLVRTPFNIDRAAPRWELWLNGRRFSGLQRMNLVEGPVSRRDYSIIHQVNVANGWGPGGAFGLNLPVPGVFTVVERKASVCLPRGDVQGDELSIEVDLGGDTPGSGMSHIFAWKVVDAGPH